MDDMLDSQVRAAMAAYGAGEISAAQAATEIAPAYAYASGERAARLDGSADPDDASTPTAFTGVALAYSTGVISAEQYRALSDAIVGPDQHKRS